MSRFMNVRRGAGVAIATVVLLVGAAACGSGTKKADAGPLPSFPAGSPEAAWQAKGHIEVGVKFDQPGFGQAEASGKPIGFDISIAKMIEKKVFGTNDGSHLHFTETTSPNRELFLEQGKDDIVIATYTMNATRAQKVDFAGPYFLAHQTVMVKADNNAVHKPEDLAGKKVCSVTGSTSIDNFRKLVPTADTSVIFSTYSECASALEDGRVDAETTDNVVLNGLAAQSNGKLKVLNDITFTDEPYGIGVKKGSPELVSMINGVLQANEADGTWKKEFEATAGKLGIPTPTPPPIAP
jgi:glutamate transport system substrate-binding protein